MRGLRKFPVVLVIRFMAPNTSTADTICTRSINQKVCNHSCRIHSIHVHMVPKHIWWHPIRLFHKSSNRHTVKQSWSSIIRSDRGPHPPSSISFKGYTVPPFPCSPPLKLIYREEITTQDNNKTIWLKYHWWFWISTPQMWFALSLSSSSNMFQRYTPSVFSCALLACHDNCDKCHIVRLFSAREASHTHAHTQCTPHPSKGKPSTMSYTWMSHWVVSDFTESRTGFFSRQLKLLGWGYSKIPPTPNNQLFCTLNLSKCQSRMFFRRLSVADNTVFETVNVSNCIL